jgi:hypothetical protein
VKYFLKFLDWLGQALSDGAHARAGVFHRVRTAEESIVDVMKECWPDASETQYDSMIWITPYPFVPYETVVECLRASRKEYGPNIEAAINGEMEKFEQAWEDGRADREAIWAKEDAPFEHPDQDQEHRQR